MKKWILFRIFSAFFCFAASPKIDCVLSEEHLLPFAWKRIPVDGGGAIMVVAISPYNPNVALAGCDVGGVFRTEDGGRSWRIANLGLQSDGDLAIADIAWHPQNPNIVYLATGKCFGKPTGNYGGLFLSNDGGKSWRLVSRAVKFSGMGDYRQWGNVLKISDNGAIYAGTAWDGLMLSNDGGKSWQKLGLEGNFIIGVAIGKNGFIAVATLKAKGSRGAVWISEDGGKSWQMTLENEDVKGISLDNKSGRVYAAIKEKGVVISDDGGKNWRVSIDGIEQFLERQWATAVVVNPVKPSTVYLCASERFEVLPEWWRWRHPGIFVSENSGESWRPIISASMVEGKFSIAAYLNAIDALGWWRGRGWFGFNPRGISVDMKTGKRLMLNDWYGVWVSDDGGESWRAAMNGLAVTVVPVILCHPKRRGEVYFGLMDVQLFRSEDDGQTVRHLGKYPASSCTNLALEVRDGEALYSVAGGRLFVSKDKGESWQVVEGNLPEGALLGPVAIDPFRPHWLYCGAFMTPDGGKTWRRLNLPENWQGRIVPDMTKLDRLYAFDGKMVLRSDDGGKSWRDVSEGLPFVHHNLRVLSAIAVQPKTGRVFVGSDVHGLFVSENGGESWRCVFPNRYISSIACAEDGDIVVVGAWCPWFAVSEEHKAGIFWTRTSQWGEPIWRRIDSEIRHNVGGIAMPTSIAVDPFYPARIYFGTGGNGAFVGEFGE
ncbi:MAG: hypothetical protein RMK18_11720 [Armatimonadota bacterium]|nr:hypothetical protein [Armatimonadota bacterium]MDW8026514.1 hypothetical protein [Armatimonadota bacterium]